MYGELQQKQRLQNYIRVPSKKYSRIRESFKKIVHYFIINARRGGGQSTMKRLN